MLRQRKPSQLNGTLLVQNGDVPRGSDILNRLVAELQVLLKADGVLNAEEDDGSCNDERAGNKTPLRRKSWLV